MQTIKDKDVVTNNLALAERYAAARAYRILKIYS
jgi:hypothetical protein